MKQNRLKEKLNAKTSMVGLPSATIEYHDEFSEWEDQDTTIEVPNEVV
jgi:hypothetical protein